MGEKKSPFAGFLIQYNGREKNHKITPGPGRRRKNSLYLFEYTSQLKIFSSLKTLYAKNALVVVMRGFGEKFDKTLKRSKSVDVENKNYPYTGDAF